LIDQGDADNFLMEQLKPELLKAACEKAGHPLTLRMQSGYEHSYFFIASFIGDHIHYHADFLK
jgi:S-formylglutathione hydrolase